MQEPRTEKLISDAKHCYDGVWLKRGDPFTASKQDAEDLECLRFAHRAPQTYQTRNMVAADPVPAPAAAVPTATEQAAPKAEEEEGAGEKPSAEARQKRGYTRRDVASDTK